MAPLEISNSDQTQEQNQELRRRRRERVIICITLLLVVIITLLEVHLVRRGQEPITGSLLAFGLVNFNTILLLLLAFLIFRNLTKLILERRQKIFGSRLRVRLVLTFVVLSLLPTLFMSFVAFQFISNRTEYQLNAQVEQSLVNSLALSQTYYQGMERKVQVIGSILSREIVNNKLLDPGQAQALTNFLNNSRADYHLNDIEVFATGGQRLNRAKAVGLGGVAEITPELFNTLQGLEKNKTYHQQSERGELLRCLTPIQMANGSGTPRAYLVVSQLIPGPVLAQIADITRGVSDLRHLQLLLHPVRVSQYMALIVVTLLVIVSAIWLALYMAKEITTPIRQLAEGTLKVADGDFNIHINLEARDEIGFLVQSFNKMTQDLQNSKMQLAAVHQQLSRNNEELEARRQYMEIVLKNVAAGVISVDGANHITTINKSAETMLEVKGWDVLGQDYKQLFPTEQYQKIAEIVGEARKSSRLTLEKPLQLNLTAKTLSLLIKPTILKDELGNDLGVVIVFEDLTELDRAQRLAAWREVARRIAHEVKNPLTPIQLSAQRLWRRYADKLGDDSQIFRECTQMIINQVEELKNLVNEFSRFARLPHLSISACNINDLLKDILILYQEVEPRISLSFHSDADLIAIQVDKEQIKRVLLNLIDNAIASIRGTGSIAIRLSHDHNREVVRVVVEDTGVGVSDRDKPRVFEPYFSTKRGGTGLGLAIVRSIISEHHGSIWVENNPPQGTRFIIELPWHSEPMLMVGEK
jgi:two-component system nitrogen regulation sensor histidine kinase NtrY